MLTGLFLFAANLASAVLNAHAQRPYLAAFNAFVAGMIAGVMAMEHARRKVQP